MGMTTIAKRKETLPDKMGDLLALQKVGREQVVADRAMLRAMEKLGIEGERRQEAQRRAQDHADAVIDIEVVIGELLIATISSSSRHEGEIWGSKKVLPEGITWDQSSQFQKMAKYPDIVEEMKAKAREAEDVVTRKAVLEAIRRKEGGPHVSHNSGDNEWYTPAEYISAARAVFGEIDLDPASSQLANTVIQAKEIYTIDDDGLAHEWFGKVWLNPPYAADLIQGFIKKLMDEVLIGNVDSAIVLVNNATDTQWFRTLATIGSVICFPTGRIRFWGKHGKVGAPLQGQAIVYVGENAERFDKEFQGFGWIATL